MIAAPMAPSERVKQLATRFQTNNCKRYHIRYTITQTSFISPLYLICFIGLSNETFSKERSERRSPPIYLMQIEVDASQPLNYDHLLEKMQICWFKEIEKQ